MIFDTDLQIGEREWKSGGTLGLSLDVCRNMRLLKSRLLKIRRQISLSFVPKYLPFEKNKRLMSLGGNSVDTRIQLWLQVTNKRLLSLCLGLFRS